MVHRKVEVASPWYRGSPATALVSLADFTSHPLRSLLLRPVWAHHALFRGQAAAAKYSQVGCRENLFFISVTVDSVLFDYYLYLTLLKRI